MFLFLHPLFVLSRENTSTNWLAKPDSVPNCLMSLTKLEFARCCVTVVASMLGGIMVASAQPVPTVMISDARLERMVDRIEALGTLRAKESIDLTATVSERVVEVGFADGDRVKEGQVLLRLSTEEAEALLTEARATAQEARQQYERVQQLANRGATALSQLDEARRESETANARLAAIETRLENLILTAPFDGVVGLRNISVGAVVRPGDLVTTLDDDSTMLLDFSVPTTFLTALEPGKAIQAQTAGFRGEVFEGTIRSLDSRVDPVTRSVTVRAEIPNPDLRLKPGLLMMVDIQANPREAIIIPESALLPLGRTNFIMVAENLNDAGEGTVQRREVTIGSRREGEVEILSGLGEGEKVVTHGGFKIADGAKIKVTESIKRAPVSQSN